MDKDDDETIAVQSLAMVDAMFDAAEEAIMSAKTVFVRPSTRTFAAEMRRALFQNESTASPTWIVSSGGFWRAGTSWLIADGRLDAYRSRASATPVGMKPIARIG